MIHVCIMLLMVWWLVMGVIQRTGWLIGVLQLIIDPRAACASALRPYVVWVRVVLLTTMLLMRWSLIVVMMMALMVMMVLMMEIAITSVEWVMVVIVVTIVATRTVVGVVTSSVRLVVPMRSVKS